MGNCPFHLPRDSFLYPSGQSCYQFNMGLNHLKTWHESINDCMSKKGKLIEINSEEEQEFITNTWKGRRDPIIHSKRLWIALYDLPGIWTWSSERKEIDFQNWAPGRPGNESGKHCALMTLSGQWNDFDCDEFNGWICEFRQNSNVDCPASLPRTYNLLSWRDHCYLFTVDFYENWHRAYTSCLTTSGGGDLVDIHSEDEQDFIYWSWVKLFQRNPYGIGLWIGLTDGQNYSEEGRWQWTSNFKELNYQNWKSGQPNNLSDLEDCALMRWSESGKWHDYPCDEKHGWICKFRKAST